MLNRIDRQAFNDSRNLLHYHRRTDFVRGTGIHVNLKTTVMPKSAFRIRILVFQSPKTLSEIAENCPDTEDHIPEDPTQACRQGSYAPNGRLLTQVRETEEGVECAMDRYYEDLFLWQRKTFDHLELDQVIQKMTVTAPFVATLYNRRLVYVNKGRTPKQFNFNRLIPLSTTWKYEPVVHSGKVHDRDYAEPDRKVYCMLIVTPITGGVLDPGQDMMGIDFDRDLDEGGADELVHHQPIRQGSIVSDAFGPPVDRGPEVIKIDHEEEEVTFGEDAEEDPDAEPQAGPSRVTRSQTRASSVQVDPQQEAMYNALINAMADNRRNAREEAKERRRLRREARPDKPPRGRKEDVNEYGWSKKATIMIRPTFGVYFKEMGNRRSRFSRR